MKSIKHIITILFITVLASASYAQSNTTHQSLLWTRYYLKLQLNDKYLIRHEVEERLFFKNWRQHQFMTRAFVDRYLGKGWNTALGIAYFSQALPQNPSIEEFTSRTEIRPVFEFGKRHILSDKFEIDHRYWQEFRFFEQDDESIDFRNIRLRYRLELRYIVSQYLTLRILDELHVNPGEKAGKSFFDQNRFALGAQYFPKEYLGFELAYINWYQQTSKLPEFYHRDILRFTLFAQLNLAKN